MPFLEGGDLLTRIKTNGRFQEKEAACICAKLAIFLHSAHGMGIMHRDLKPENILLKSKHSNVDICVADFGLARLFNKGVYALRTQHHCPGRRFGRLTIAIDFPYSQAIGSATWRGRLRTCHPT
jgi:serine/threonine protein kinase